MPCCSPIQITPHIYVVIPTAELVFRKCPECSIVDIFLRGSVVGSYENASANIIYINLLFFTCYLFASPPAVGFCWCIGCCVYFFLCVYYCCSYCQNSCEHDAFGIFSHGVNLFHFLLMFYDSYFKIVINSILKIGR